jgi:anti-sigma factor RsiW
MERHDHTMKQETKTEEQLIQYLLGQLHEEEQARIEEQYFADRDFHDELRAIERDLMDRYVHGELPQPEQEQFERYFLSSPRRRQKVEFARALMQSLAQAPAAAAAESASDRSLMLPVLTGRHRAWLWAAAAVVILIGGWLIVSWQKESSLNQAEQTAQQPRDQRPSGQPTIQPPESTSQQTPPITRPPEVVPPPRPGPPLPVRVATIVLTPSLGRGSDATPKLIIDGHVQVRLQLHFEEGDYTTYQAVLRTAEGDEVWRQDQLMLRRTQSGPAIIVTLPASHFSSRDYTIRLSGVTAEAAVEEVSSYYFRAEKR